LFTDNYLALIQGNSDLHYVKWSKATDDVGYESLYTINCLAVNHDNTLIAYGHNEGFEVFNVETMDSYSQIGDIDEHYKMDVHFIKFFDKSKYVGLQNRKWEFRFYQLDKSA
jgi:hypothetical protein